MEGKRHKYKNHTFIKVIIVIGVLYVFGTYFALTHKLDKSRAAYEQLKKDHAAAQQNSAEFADLIENGINGADDYIIKAARENGYILPTERVFIDIYSE